MVAGRIRRVERPTDTLAAQAAALAQRVAELAWAGEAASLAEVADGLTDAALIECLERVGSLSNLVDAIGSRLAGVFTARSARDGEEPLAKRLGSRSAPLAVAAVAHVSTGTATGWCQIGDQLRLRRSLTGELLPEPHPVTAAALETGSIGADAASLILDTLGTVADQADPERLTAWEEFLVGEALTESSTGLRQACRALIAHADPDGIQPREEELRAKAGVRILTRRDGITRYLIDADPESDGWLRTALDARTAPRREVRSTDQDVPSDTALEDSRTLGQKRLDALVGIARDSLTHDPGEVSGTAVTMLVTITHDALVTGIGAATIDGIDQPISAATARRLACHARILPVVLGGDSQPLDLGQSRRLFSQAQRYAMTIRDRGCIWPGCHEPPGRCEAAHLTAWHQSPGLPHGPTDLSNGVLLCRFHHRRLDNDGWTIRFIDRTPHLIPPPWVDPTGTPRPAGRHTLAA